MSVDVVIVGAGGHATEVAAYVRRLSAGGEPVNLLGLVDDKTEQAPLAGTRVLGKLDRLFELAGETKHDLYYITAVGDNRVRKSLVQRIEAAGRGNLHSWTCAHSDTSIGRDSVTIGSGTCLAPGAIVTARTRIGRHCIVNVNTSVSHDCDVGDFCNLNPGSILCGNVTLGEGCYVGAGATIIQRISVGPWTVIGAGAVVVNDLPAGVTAAGVPARVL